MIRFNPDALRARLARDRAYNEMIEDEERYERELESEKQKQLESEEEE